MNGKKLLTLFTTNKWHSINNRFSQKKYDTPEVKEILARTISIISSRDGKSELRVLDGDLCKELLATIKVEKKSHDWINKIIQKS